jgi:hypothetical protein
LSPLEAEKESRLFYMTESKSAGNQEETLVRKNLFIRTPQNCKNDHDGKLFFIVPIQNIPNPKNPQGTHAHVEVYCYVNTCISCLCSNSSAQQIASLRKQEAHLTHTFTESGIRTAVTLPLLPIVFTSFS